MIAASLASSTRQVETMTCEKNGRRIGFWLVDSQANEGAARDSQRLVNPIDSRVNP